MLQDLVGKMILDQSIHSALIQLSSLIYLSYPTEER